MHNHHGHAAFHARRSIIRELNIPQHNETVVETASPLPTPEPLSHRLWARSSNCTDDDSTNSCEKPVGSNTVPIVLAAVIPLGIAMVVLIYLHRKGRKKLDMEDLNDKHKSLDFGLDEAGGSSRKKAPKKLPNGLPEMTVTDTEKQGRRGRGMSLDLSMGSPYLMPPGVQESRESFQSLSRSMQDVEDPYRPVTFISSGDSVKDYPRIRPDNASIYTGDSVATDNPSAGLLKNARPMSQTAPQRGDSLSTPSSSPPHIQIPERTLSPSVASPSTMSPPTPCAPPSITVGVAVSPSDSPNELLAEPTPAMVKQPEPLPMPTAEPPIDEKRLSAAPKPSRIVSQEAVIQDTKTLSIMTDGSDYGDGFKITPPSEPRQSTLSIQVPTIGVERSQTPDGEGRNDANPTGLGISALDEAKDNNRLSNRMSNRVSQRLSIIQPSGNRLSMSLRPLPVEDPTENPEERANRIRSFYKEYFDDSKPEPMPPMPAQYARNEHAYDDYNQEYMQDGAAVFDPDSGNFVLAGPTAPFAEPITRRAMTPPPRAPPRFQGPGPRGRASSGSSRFMPPRGMSAMSARPAPRKNLPPPKDLMTIPTPSQLKDDAFLIEHPLDFAPPMSYRDRQAGRRPDSPMGEARPYSPSVAPHVPLANAFEELAPIPSPHALRKSGTFTSLDFAPPPRFRNVETGSDAGSIRSNRSGISQVQLQAVRSGAYRVSRIPKEMVGTRDDLTAALRPTWTLGGTDPRNHV